MKTKIATAATFAALILVTPGTALSDSDPHAVSNATRRAMNKGRVLYHEMRMKDAMADLDSKRRKEDPEEAARLDAVSEAYIRAQVRAGSRAERDALWETISEYHSAREKAASEDQRKSLHNEIMATLNAWGR